MRRDLNKAASLGGTPNALSCMISRIVEDSRTLHSIPQRVSHPQLQFGESTMVELTLQVTINNGRRREVKYRQSQEVFVDIPETITEHGLSSENTQSSGGSSDASEGSENSGSFKDYGSSGKGLML
ncbi:hypothetical protein Tco_0750560 [Tanacetum coccineum]|uniref:Uncharacterized protein n=1 Tax=Tanacetum coccineum TaxID=301880 RepID=A0ABQ4Z1L7_9ASTR